MTRADLLITDLDGTLLGDERAMREFAQWWVQSHGTMRLVYASGRFCDSVEQSIQHWQLPLPDAIIGGVGTEIRLYPSGERMVDWEERWWPRWDAGYVRSSLTEFGGLTLQPSEFQSDFKTSYYLTGASPNLLRSAQRALIERRIAADLIYSSNRDLDVVPQGVNKGTAALFLARRWGLSPSTVIVAGDSGNDLSLFVQHFRGIIVANAHPELKALTGPSAYHSKFNFAAGLLDGMQYGFNPVGPFIADLANGQVSKLAPTNRSIRTKCVAALNWVPAPNRTRSVYHWTEGTPRP